MAVTDFGTRRFADSAPRQARQYPYQHQAQDDYDEDNVWYEDDQHYAEDAPEGLGARLGRLTNYIGAVVSVIAADGAETAEATTGSQGGYMVADLPAGAYDVSVATAGSDGVFWPGATTLAEAKLLGGR